MCCSRHFGEDVQGLLPGCFQCMDGRIVADHIGQNPHFRHRGEDVYSILPSCHPTKGSDTHVALLEIYFHVFLSHNLGCLGVPKKTEQSQYFNMGDFRESRFAITIGYDLPHRQLQLNWEFFSKPRWRSKILQKL